MSPILQGCAVGFSIAAPVGAIGFLCIQQSIRGGMKLGFVSGLGAATADTFYGVLVALGMSSLQQWLLIFRLPLLFFGGIFLSYLGIKKIRSKPYMMQGQTKEHNLWYAYISTCLLTLTNPGTILDFMALFSALSIDISSTWSALIFVFGVFAGSACWWLLLSYVTSAFRHKVSESLLQWINYVAGTAILAFGLFSLGKCLYLFVGF